MLTLSMFQCIWISFIDSIINVIVIGSHEKSGKCVNCNTVCVSVTVWAIKIWTSFLMKTLMVTFSQRRWKQDFQTLPDCNCYWDWQFCSSFSDLDLIVKGFLKSKTVIQTVWWLYAWTNIMYKMLTMKLVCICMR